MKAIFKTLFIKEPMQLEAPLKYLDVSDKEIWIVISSVIYYNVSDGIERSSYSFEERLEQTMETIKSIRKNLSQAKILFAEGGTVDVANEVKEYVDEYLYLGKNKTVTRAVSHKNKGYGETAILRHAYKMINGADFIFKISGRYSINKNFCIDNIDLDRLNFVNYVGGGREHPAGSKVG